MGESLEKALDQVRGSVAISIGTTNDVVRNASLDQRLTSYRKRSILDAAVKSGRLAKGDYDKWLARDELWLVCEFTERLYWSSAGDHVRIASESCDRPASGSLEEALAQALLEVPTRHAFVISSIYGLRKGGERNFAATAVEMGYTEGWVGKLFDQAMEKLQKPHVAKLVEPAMRDLEGIRISENASPRRSITLAATILQWDYSATLLNDGTYEHRLESRC